MAEVALRSNIYSESRKVSKEKRFLEQTDIAKISAYVFIYILEKE